MRYGWTDLRKGLEKGEKGIQSQKRCQEPFRYPTIAEYQYDPAGRRIRKDVYLGGILDNVEHAYYLGHSNIETRNGSDHVTQQHVWDSMAGHYIDSLAQVGNNTNPSVAGSVF